MIWPNLWRRRDADQKIECGISVPQLRVVESRSIDVDHGSRRRIVTP
jgi:hypothetical protein